MSLSTESLLNSPQPGISKITSLPTAENSQGIQINDVQENDISRITKTVKIWKGAINERLADTRQLHATHPSSTTILALSQDRETVHEYLELMERFNFFIAHHKEKPVLKIASDRKNNIQGICCATIHRNQMFIHHIFTAPWNLKMHGKIADEHQPLVTKGCGTQLIASCYGEAEKIGCGELRLKALTGSASFYKDYLKMGEDKENNEFYFPITPGAIPNILANRITQKTG